MVHPQSQPSSFSFAVHHRIEETTPGAGGPGPRHGRTGTITTPIIGMAMGAYADHIEMQQKRVRAAYLGEKASLDPFAAVRIARASSEIDAA